MKNSLQNVFLKLSFLLVLLGGTFTYASAQSVDTNLARVMLVGQLENYILSKLGGKLGQVEVSERYNFSNVTCFIASRKVTSRLGTMDQITIKITEAGKTQVLSLVQGSDGKLSELQGTQLVALRSNNPLNCITQLFGAASACSACKTKIVNCINQNSTFLSRMRCIGRSFDGTCISCGVSLFSIASCLRGN